MVKNDTKLKAFLKEFIAHGHDCGIEIAKLLQKKHPDAIVYPLYRSAVAIEYDKKKRCIYIYTSGDPHFMGQEITDETIPFYGADLAINGQRTGPDLLQKDISGKWSVVR